MNNLIKKLTANLPDWFNPVYVKELRQALHSRSFWVVSIMVVVLEALLFYVTLEGLDAIRRGNLWSGISLFPQMDDPESAFSAQMLHIVLSHVWLFCAVGILQPTITRWTEERQLDAVAPERTTCLSAGTILRGKILFHVTLLAWIVLLLLPIFCWLCPKVTPNMLRSYLCTASISFLLILTLMIWSTNVAMSMRIRRNVTSGLGFFGWGGLVIGTIFIFVYQNCLINLFQFSNYALEYYAIGIFTLVSLLVYGGLVLLAIMKPEQSNRMFTTRIGGYGLCLLTVLCGWICTKELADQITVTLVNITVFVLIFGYIAFQSMLALFEPLYMPKRMSLDAPKNPLGKLIWYICGTGSICAWIHLLIPFALVTVFFYNNSLANFDVTFFSCLFVFCLYMIIYSTVGSLLRIRFPKLNGGAILLILCIFSWILDLVLIAHELYSLTYMSPVAYFIQRYNDMQQQMYSNIQEVAVSFVEPVLIVAWACVILMLIVFIFMAMRKKQERPAES